MTSQESAVIAKLASIESTLDRIDHELFGNGQPGRLKEIEVRIEELEEVHDQSRGALWVLRILVGALGLFDIVHWIWPKQPNL